MAQILINVVFKILNFIANIFMLPFKILLSVFPSLTPFVTSILDFFNLGFNYITFFLKLIMIPQSLILVVVTFTTSLFTIALTLKIISLRYEYL